MGHTLTQYAVKDSSSGQNWNTEQTNSSIGCCSLHWNSKSYIPAQNSDDPSNSELPDELSTSLI